MSNESERDRWASDQAAIWTETDLSRFLDPLIHRPDHPSLLP